MAAALVALPPASTWAPAPMIALVLPSRVATARAAPTPAVPATPMPPAVSTPVISSWAVTSTLPPEATCAFWPTSARTWLLSTVTPTAPPTPTSPPPPNPRVTETTLSVELAPTATDWAAWTLVGSAPSASSARVALTVLASTAVSMEAPTPTLLAAASAPARPTMVLPSVAVTLTVWPAPPL